MGKVNLKHHPYHIVPGTLLPLKVATALFIFAAGLIIFFHSGFSWFFFIGIILLITYLYNWSEAVATESLDKEIHTKEVQEQLMFGGILFIISETMLFFGFFWAFFHNSLNPSIFLGGVFPPKGITPLNPFHWPLINTLTLLLSGIFVNSFYYSLKGWWDRRAQLGIKEVSNTQLERENEGVSSIEAGGSSSKREDAPFRSKLDLVFLSTNKTPILALEKRESIAKPSSASAPSMAFPLNLVYGSNNELGSDKKTASWNTILQEANLYQRGDELTDIEAQIQKIHASLLFTISLGVIFLIFQVHEYINHASFELSDSVYGSVFYLLTGLHGFHVLAGIIFLFFCYLKLSSPSNSLFDKESSPHVGVTFSVAYFHYVDIVWLFLYVFVYLWGG